MSQESLKVSGLSDSDELKANVGLTRAERTWIKRIQEALSFDLLNPKYRELVSPYAHYVTGHCCVATEAAYYLFGKDAGFKPYMQNVSDDVTHWWLFHPERKVLLDVTSPQVAEGFAYSKSKKWQPFQGHGKPSWRALLLMIRVLLARTPKTNRNLLENILRQVSNF